MNPLVDSHHERASAREGCAPHAPLAVPVGDHLAPGPGLAQPASPAGSAPRPNHVSAPPAHEQEVRSSTGSESEVAPTQSRDIASSTAADEIDAEDADLNLQHTIGGPAVIKGLGLFSGVPVTCTILPAHDDHGIVFERVDLPDHPRIPAGISQVIPRGRRTSLKMNDAVVETVEHCMSALAGLRIDNALIQIDNAELPCGDGSALPYVESLLRAGIVRQQAVRRYVRITEPITVQDGDSMIAALPADKADFHILFDLDYGGDPRLRRQLHACRMSTGDYASEIAPARTFSLQEEAQELWNKGLCHHLTPRDVLVIGHDGPIDNAYRFNNEPVRHKVLDLIGDLYLLGRPIHGRVVAYRSGHSLNHQLAYRLLERMRAEQRLDVNRQRQMDVRSIMKLMRHRYPMLLVDRVTEIHGDQRAVGVKNVTINEPFFQGHYPGTPIMPGVLIVEAMAQLSGLLLSRVLEHTGRIAVLLSLDKVKLRRAVVPGDQLVMEAETLRAQNRTASMQCKAFVGGTLAAEAQIKFLMIDAEDDNVAD